MLIVKLVKFEPSSGYEPTVTSNVSIREANAVHVVRYEPDMRTIQLGDAPGETFEVTIGDRLDCGYSVAYVMNSNGKTVETIR